MDGDSQVRNFLSVLAELQRLSAFVGTPNDGVEVRNGLKSIRERGAALEQSIFDTRQRMKASGKQLSVLLQEFDFTCELWKSTLRNSLDKEARYPLPGAGSPSFSLPPPQPEPESIQWTFRPEKIRVLDGPNYTSEDAILREIVQERNAAVREVHKEVRDVAEVLAATGRLVREQREPLDNIQQAMAHGTQVSEAAVQSTAQAAKQSTVSWTTGMAVGSLFGAAMGMFLGPAGAILGGSTGAAAGAVVTRKIGDLQIKEIDRELFEHSLKDKWVPDDQAVSCHRCRAEFTQIRRRHHCRKCGQVFCKECSSHKMAFKLPGMDKERVARVCETCFAESWSR